MIFKNDAHKAFYESHHKIYIQNGELDHNRSALIYTLGMDEDCRDHFDDLYNKDTGCVCGDDDICCWVTSSSQAVIRLAFDLFHDGPIVLTKDRDKQLALLENYSTASVFGNLAYHGLTQYGIQALQLRYGFS